MLPLPYCCRYGLASKSLPKVCHQKPLPRTTQAIMFLPPPQQGTSWCRTPPQTKKRVKQHGRTQEDRASRRNLRQGFNSQSDMDRTSFTSPVKRDTRQRSARLGRGQRLGMSEGVAGCTRAPGSETLHSTPAYIGVVETANGVVYHTWSGIGV